MTKPEVRTPSKRNHTAMLHHSGFGLLSSLVILVSSFASALAQTTADRDQLRAEKVGWARLKTASPLWRRHSWSDPLLMRFFREQTTLNIDPTWYSADVEKLDEMCGYPFLFAQSISEVQNPSARSNLAEYIRRGGFLLIDGCINPDTRPTARVFIEQQTRAVALTLPEARIVALANDHQIFRCFFQFANGAPHTSETGDWGRYGLLGIEIGSRMVGVISTSGLQCGWDGRKNVPGHEELSMQMLVNIYLYAMLQGGGAPSAK